MYLKGTCSDVTKTGVTCERLFLLCIVNVIDVRVHNCAFRNWLARVEGRLLLHNLFRAYPVCVEDFK